LTLMVRAADRRILPTDAAPADIFHIPKPSLA
jgi:hypothetical protein